jgi:hypothetical protein
LTWKSDEGKDMGIQGIVRTEKLPASCAGAYEGLDGKIRMGWIMGNNMFILIIVWPFSLIDQVRFFGGRNGDRELRELDGRELPSLFGAANDRELSAFQALISSLRSKILIALTGW